MGKFKCSVCGHVFDAEGQKKEYDSHLYGMNWKYMANCPLCNSESDEHQSQSQKKRASSGSSCGSGGCCCGHS